MKEFLEIESREKREDLMRGEPLRCPEQRRREQRAEKQRRGKVGEQSRCVFQGSNVRLRRDAQSTHMDGKG